MRAAVPLLVYATLLATAVPRLLVGASWADRAPRLAICLWQALSVSVLAATGLAGLALAVPTAKISGDIAELLRACVMSLRASYATPGGAVVAGAGLTLTTVLMLRVGSCAVAGLVRAGRARRAHAAKLAILARPAPGLDAVVIPHPAAAAYCLPGRARQVVLTTTALETLSVDQLHAVLAHERAHLTGRHHLVVAGADAFARAFPTVPLFTAARAELARLVELAADDAASRQHERLSVAAALVALAGGGSPDTGLAAGGPTALGRVRRLLQPARPLGTARTMLGAVLVAAVLVTPVAVAAGPILAVTHALYCPLTLPVS
ncbi:M56 family metallopeptidase [Pseudofrankia sp. BMG5.37]|uniref:M56 family metallopeptidase n=1 Tax=Pseudofrankia sp. BMG5.37 TaxID=3050035 RepID=UPI002894CC23|nr:M56 family metallopeptidase [Pseudofrankia sp. BMG5.37]MDT3442673.1 M56 family metallopeptidase [Pseudofrankia sp. BMG5.37]